MKDTRLLRVMRLACALTLLHAACGGTLSPTSDEQEQQDPASGQPDDGKSGDGDVARPEDADAGAQGEDGGDVEPGDGDANEPGDEPVTPGPDARAAKQRVLDYFAGIAGQYALSGIENKFNDDPHGHTDELARLAGKTPAFWGADFGFGGGTIDSRDGMIAEAKAQWSQGAIVALMYHTCVPTRDEYCDWDDIGGAHPQHLSDDEWDALFSEGTSIHAEWMARLDRLASYFQQLKDAGVAPLFRPLHEMNQCAFWWSCKDGEHGTRALWKLTHDYLTVEKGLDNIVWVWNVQDFESLGSDVGYLNPGSDYFDLATLDIYNTGFTSSNYQTMLDASGDKPIGIGECQFLPSAELLASQPAWTFFMLWPDFLYEQRNLDIYTQLFASERVLTLDEMPGWD